MGVPDSEMLTQGEVESALQSELQQHNNNNNKNPFSSLGRQSSIYSLTLDEFQHTLCEGGKNFGSMNMDEFLTSIWNAEENQATNDTAATSNTNFNTGNLINNQSRIPLNDTALGNNVITKQPSLPRQGSLTLPAPLCRKTVDEVWSEIHRGQQGQQQGSGGNDGSNNNNSNNNNNNGSVKTTETATRQPTFGEMTLEDFLIKAGVVREQCALQPTQQPTPQQQFGLYQSNNNNGNVMSPGFSARPVMGMATGGGAPGGNNSSVGGVYQPMPPGHGGIMGETPGPYVGGDKRSNGGYGAQRAQAPPPSVVCYGGRVGNGGGFGAGMVAAPVSPGVSSEGVCNPQLDGGAGGGQFGMEMGGLRGKKRIVDGPVEKVVERRQRRMIKNRESAARSRARKQAYTVELEAELNQLKDENNQLKQALAELERKRKQQYFEELKMMKAYTKAQKAKEKLRIMRRNLSCPL